MECINSQMIDKGTGTISKYLILSVNECVYAIKVPYIHKVVGLPCVISLSCAKPYILGTTKVDGAVYTVVDLHVLFGAEPKAFPQRTMAVLLAYGESKICAVVDDVLSVISIDMNSVIYPFSRKCYVYGVVQINGEIIFLLSIEDLIMSGNM